MQIPASANGRVHPIGITRRGLVASFAVAPMAISELPMMTRTAHARAMAANVAAERRFCGLPHDLEFADEARFHAEEKRLHAAGDAVLAAEPVDWAEFVSLLIHVTENGTNSTTEEASAALVRHARKLERI